jgi:hypothetical protein
MEATLIGVPRTVSAQADEQSKTAATIINLSCITSIQETNQYDDKLLCRRCLQRLKRSVLH